MRRPGSSSRPRACLRTTTAIVAGPYEKVTSELTNSEGRVIPLGVYARKSLMPFVDAEDMFELTRQGFEFYEEQFKTPYPFEKYDQLFVPEFNAGAMENAGCVTYPGDLRLPFQGCGGSA